MADKVQRSGRIEYIEPNSLFTDGPIQNGIPQPYENYSFSVNLRVVNGNRYDCGLPGSGRDILGKALEFSSDNGTLSFIDGTANGDEQGYLTTNFTDISMNNPDTNTRECLGIESINIKYNSWYTPTVDIKFVDVRVIDGSGKTNVKQQLFDLMRGSLRIIPDCSRQSRSTGAVKLTAHCRCLFHDPAGHGRLCWQLTACDLSNGGVLFHPFPQERGLPELLPILPFNRILQDKIKLRTGRRIFQELEKLLVPVPAARHRQRFVQDHDTEIGQKRSCQHRVGKIIG